MKEVIFKDLGLIDYKKAWDYQENLLKTAVDIKKAQRKGEQTAITKNHLLFCEHPHVYTLGKSGERNNLLIDDEKLKEKAASFFQIDRGGDITYHGPGQLVAYPILDLEYFFTDIHKYLRLLEEAIILTLLEYGITGERYKGYTGVWVEPENPSKARKIAAIGVRCSRWITMHGFALNVNANLSYFNNIIPCGITNKGVTSMEVELGKKIEMESVKEKIKYHLSTLFDMKLIV